ncbi:hypothetical protein FPV67DRAFT_1473231 [Lyophyllum atratum]|nr:hypothetical protein FPV67DRAFT_1473231 [Lyophyllum atratum]
MPLIYHSRSSNSISTDGDSDDHDPTASTSASASPLVPTDADDSIVLSDLVRTGEASRLRRRGAMRLDHTYPHAHAHPPRSPSLIVVHEPPSWDSEPEDTPHAHPRPRTRPTRRHAVEDEPDYSYALFCGGDVSTEEEAHNGTSNDHTPYTPSVLPLYPPPPRPSPSRLKHRRKRTSTTGCGARIHSAAAPRRRASPLSSSPTTTTNTWHALSPGASSGLAPLDAMYFDDARARAQIRAGREGVGCAVCGNPLGLRARGRKEGGRVSMGSEEGAGYTYSFFAGAVSSEPAYTFPSPSSSNPTSTSQQQDTQDLSDPETQPPSSYTLTLLDRLITASPTPLSDEEREAYRARAPPAAQPRYSYGYPGYGYGYGYGGGYGGGMYDADGEVVEPGSPKAGEMVLVPER